MQHLLREIIISATGLSFVCGVVLGVLVMWLPKFIKRRLLRKKVEAAYSMLRMVCEPKTLNPAQLGNREYMISESRDLVNAISLKSAGFRPPQKCDRSEKSLNEWFTFLQDVRIELASWF